MLRYACNGIRRRSALEARFIKFRPHNNYVLSNRNYAKTSKASNGSSNGTKTDLNTASSPSASKIIRESTEKAKELEPPKLSETNVPVNLAQYEPDVEPVDVSGGGSVKEGKTSTQQGDPATDEANLEAMKDEYLTTIFEDMEPYMDTYSVYTQLVAAGFTGEQADEVINLIVKQINTKLSKLSTKYSQLFELENEKYLFESAQQELRVDITRSREKHINELTNLLHLLERDFNILSDELNGDFIKMKNDTQVATNDQKSENTLQSKKIILRIQETNHKITTELNSAMRSEIESLRWHISRWGLMAILVSVFSGCTTFYIHKVKSSKAQSKHDFVPLVIYEPSEYEEDDYHTDLDKNLVV